MKLDKEYMNKLESTEKQTLLHIQSRLSDSDKDYIAKDAQDLLNYQEKNRENVGVLPNLKVSVPSCEAHKYEYEVYNEIIDHRSVIECDYSTNII